MKLFERRPAAKFGEAHLLGNGRLGATVYGGVPFEEVLINDDTLWSGSESYHINEHYYENLKKAQAMVLSGDVKTANDLINDEMEGNWGEAYMPLASVHFLMGQRDDRRNMKLRRVMNTPDPAAIGYTRTLDLDTAVETVEYERDGVKYRREYFVSYDYQLVYARFTAEGGALNFAMSVDSKLKHSIAVEGGEVTLRGIAPDRAEPSYTPMVPGLTYLNEDVSDALRFGACARVISTDGTVWCDRSRVYVNDASLAVVAIAAGTNYAGYAQPRNKDVNAVIARLNGQLDNAAGWDEAYKAHIADYTALYDRVKIDLGEEITGEVPTSQRFALNGGGVFDPSVAALAAQYGRYLLITGSRPGSQAENLQGIWNDSVMPPWSSNYTTNINVQMNYWPAEVFGLSECHSPMFDLISETAQSGRRTAQDYYHAGGWVAHHNVDLWRMTVPACEDATWFFWPFGGVWMAQHLWTHYEYTHDDKFLKETAYPILKEAARFMLDYMCEDGEYLTIAPSTSPENKHMIPGGRSFRDMVSEVDPENRFPADMKEVSALTKGSCMDITFARELFGNVLRGAAIVGDKHDPLLDKLSDAIKRLPPYGISKFGTLQEWHEDYEECTPGMSHMSHLYSVYPANIINERDFPAEYEAAFKSLQRRVAHGGLTFGWPGSWALCLAARFHDRGLATRQLTMVPTEFSPNMLATDSVQIDSIFGFAAGVAEMLIQSHNGYIELLPTPAYGWVDGEYSGLMARGGFECALRWRSDELRAGSVISHLGDPCAIKARGLKGVLTPDGRLIQPDDDGIVRFESAAGAEYKLAFAE